MQSKKEKNPDHNPTKEKAPVSEPVREEERVLSPEEPIGEEALGMDIDEELAELDGEAWGDELADDFGRSEWKIDPNDMEIRQKHAEDEFEDETDLDSAA